MNKQLQKTVNLKYPITLDGIKTTTLTMRRPKAIDVLTSIESAADETERIVKLIANLCMVAPETIEELDAADFATCNREFAEMTEFEAVEKYTPGEDIKLSFPLTIGQKAIHKLSLRRPKVKDISAARKASPNSDARQECELFASLAGLRGADILELDWSDYRTLKAIYGDFLE